MDLATGVLLAVIALAFQMKHKLSRTVCVLAFLGGIGIASALAGWLADLTGSSLWGIGVALPAAAFVFIIFWHDVIPKWGDPRRWVTPVLGMILPALLVVGLGGVAGTVIKRGLNEFGQRADQVKTSLLGNRG